MARDPSLIIKALILVLVGVLGSGSSPNRCSGRLDTCETLNSENPKPFNAGALVLNDSS